MSGFSLAGVLQAIKDAGSMVEPVAKVVETFLPLLTSNDAATLKEALIHARADNDEGYARLDALLAEAEKQ